jgi:hypothetical protein
MMVAMELTTLLWWRPADDDHQNEGCGINHGDLLALPHVAPHLAFQQIFSIMISALPHQQLKEELGVDHFEAGPGRACTAMR